MAIRLNMASAYNTFSMAFGLLLKLFGKGLQQILQRITFAIK